MALRRIRAISRIAALVLVAAGTTTSPTLADSVEVMRVQLSHTIPPCLNPVKSECTEGPIASYNIVNKTAETISVTVECTLYGKNETALRTGLKVDTVEAFDITGIGFIYFEEVGSKIENLICKITKADQAPASTEPPHLIRDEFACSSIDMLYHLIEFESANGEGRAFRTFAYGNNCRLLSRGERVYIKGQPMFLDQRGGLLERFVICVGLPDCYWIERNAVKGDLGK